MSKRAPRVDVRKAAIVVNSDGDEISVTILDISGSGFRLHVLEKLNIGEFVRLRVDDQILSAQIRWVLGDEAGGAFLANADEKELGAG
jgi:hypothetical protein